MVRPGFRTAAVLCLFTFLGISVCQARDDAESVEERTAVSLDPSTHTLTGETTIAFGRCIGEETRFELTPGATLLGVTLEGKAADFSFTGGNLAVRIPPALKGKECRVAIAFRAVFNDAVPARIVSTEDPTYGVDGVISRAGTFLGGGAAWYPRSPVLPARRTVEITAPSGMEAITAGARIERRTAEGKTVSVWREKHPAPYPALSAGPYLISERMYGTIPLYAYFLADASSLASAYLDASAEYLRLYEELFGPYPYEKFAVVENFIPTGYGFPSYTLLGGSVIRLPFIIGTSLPHEIAHNWWGNGVEIDIRGGNWSEGLVTYLADYLLEERKSMAAGREYRFRILTDFASLVPDAGDFPLAEFIGRTDPASRAIGYGKAAMVFHMVRKMIGDQAFFGALRDVCRQHLYRQAAWSDFIRAFSRAAGKDVAPFVEQWLVRQGGPRLFLADVTSRAVEGKWVVRGRVVQAQPFWNFPVDLQVETAAGDVRQSLSVTGEYTTFTFSLAAPPGRLFLDRDSDLFRVLPPDEIPPAVNRLKGAQKLLALVTRRCNAREETIRMLLESLGHRGGRVVHEDDVTDDDLAGHDLLICGIPAKKRLLPLLPEAVALSGPGFAVGGEAFSSSDDALFAVSRHPTAPDRLAGLFIPLSESAADACAMKISHYGKYGYLVFTRGNNRKKGILPVSGGRTVVDFNEAIELPARPGAGP